LRIANFAKSNREAVDGLAGLDEQLEEIQVGVSAMTILTAHTLPSLVCTSARDALSGRAATEQLAYESAHLVNTCLSCPI
jgi:hypothetical protein